VSATTSSTCGGTSTGRSRTTTWPRPPATTVNGPYRVSAWEQGQSLTLERNDRYFGPKAAALLEQAGYAKGADGISTTAGNQLRETQEQLIQAQLKQIGVDIKIVNADSTKFFGEWLPQGNFDSANLGWVGNPFAISSSQDIYRTGGGNYGAYESRKVDDLFAQAVREVDEARSAELGNQIDQQLTADMATIPLYAKPTYLAVRDRFANVGDNATQEGPFWNSGL
jgi:peptide/nickel transport system substrate-binding protein